MEPLSRRGFLKLGGAATAGIVLLNPAKAGRFLRPPPEIALTKKLGEITSICAYCAGGCGIIVSSDGNKVISIEGYPDHPVNRGALCSKAQGLYQIRTVDGKLNSRRMTKVLYRAPNGTAWEEKTWDWALDEIAKKIKKTRDESFIEKDKDGVLVNRNEAIAQVGGSAHDNEECYLHVKMERALGMVYIETQARL